MRGKRIILIALTTSVACAAAQAATPFFATPTAASGELSVGRSFHWFSITPSGDSVASMSSVAPPNSLPPVQFGPAGETPFAIPAGTGAAAMGLLADGTRMARLSGMLDGNPVGTRLAFWNPGATEPTIAQSLGVATNGSALTFAVSHNPQGDVVGYATRYVDGVAAGSSRPVKWSRDGTIVELGIIATDGSQPETRAQRISAGGHIVGFGRASAGSDFRPIRWLPGSTQAIELDTFEPLAANQIRGGDVNAINNAGTAVGASHYFTNTTATYGKDRAVRWENGSAAMTPLDGLSETQASAAYGVNERGDAVGDAYADNGPSRAVLWLAGQTQPIMLDGLPGLPSTASGDRAYAINNARSVVGYASSWSNNTFQGHRAALWLNGSTQLLDLNTLLPADAGWRLEEAGAITETGFIRGTGKFDPDGAGGVAAYSRSWTLLVPEAGTYGRGDANFDTLVNFDDLLLLAQHYGQDNPDKDVNVADFNFDGVTDFSDLLALAQHYGSGVDLQGGMPADFAADWALAQSLVPEPATLTVLFAVLPRGRRRLA